MTTKLLRLAAVLTVAMGASACSTVPDWVDPTTWGSDTPAPQSDNAQTPDLADIPNKPAPASTPDEQKQVSDSLAADRSQTNYSAEQLRGGGEASAPPPGAESAADRQAASAAVSQANQSSKSTPATDATAPAPASDASQASPPSDQRPAQEAPAAPSTQSSDAPPPAPMADNTPPATQVAEAGPPPQATSSAPPPGAEPAVPMSSNEGTPLARNYASPAAPVSPSDAALGFKPSNAPPLDPSVAQFVSAPIIAHYEQTAAVASTTVLAPTNVASTIPTRRSRHARHGIGGPERMSGAVVANLDAIQSSPTSSPAAYMTAAGMPAAVVFFPGDGTTLNADARAQVRQAVAAFKAGGEKGFVRVVGHSSSRTPNMSVERHLELIFQRSKVRADNVARELIHMGVPPSKVLEEAVGDSQPVYYESMPKGEDGNRRAEIFLQT